MGQRYTVQDLLVLRRSPLVIKPRDLPNFEELLKPHLEDKSRRVASERTKAHASPYSSPKPSWDLGSSRAFDEPSEAQSGTSHISDLGTQSQLSADSRRGWPGRERVYASVDRHALHDAKAFGPPGSSEAGKSRLYLDSSRPHDGWATDRRHRTAASLATSKTRPDTRGSTSMNGHTRWTSHDGQEKHSNWRSQDTFAQGPGNRELTYQEQDPEWMHEDVETDESKQFTSQDIEQWKANMKAKVARPVEGSSQLEDLSSSVPSQIAATAATSKNDGPGLALEAGGPDGFLGLWTHPIPGNDDSASESYNLPSTDSARTLAKGSKASRFTHFFSPPVTSRTGSASDVTGARTIPDGSEQADFNRILSMLGVPEKETQLPVKPSPPLEQLAAVSNSNREATEMSPGRHDGPSSADGHLPIGQTSARPGSKPSTNADTQFLLNLMRSGNEAPLPFAQHRPTNNQSDFVSHGLSQPSLPRPGQHGPRPHQANQRPFHYDGNVIGAVPSHHITPPHFGHNFHQPMHVKAPFMQDPRAGPQRDTREGWPPPVIHEAMPLNHRLGSPELAFNQEGNRPPLPRQNNANSSLDTFNDMAPKQDIYSPFAMEMLHDRSNRRIPTECIANLPIPPPFPPHGNLPPPPGFYSFMNPLHDDQRHNAHDGSGIPEDMAPAAV